MAKFKRFDPRNKKDEKHNKKSDKKKVYADPYEDKFEKNKLLREYNV